MKILLLIPLFFLISCSGCKKEIYNPNHELIGTWVSRDPILQFPILNTEGTGNHIVFLKFEKDGKNYLKVTHPNGEDTYTIKHIGKKEMVLIDSLGKDISFFKFE